MLERMDRDSAMDQLPLTYQRLFSLLDTDRSAAEISQELGVDETSLPALVRVGTAKLDALLQAAHDENDR